LPGAPWDWTDIINGLCGIGAITVSASKSGNTAVALNSAVNTFMDKKKLKLSLDKCSQIRNKASNDKCAQHKVHQNQMKSSREGKYLGDYITRKGNSKDTIDIPLGK
jgi:hypothetical protein